MRRNKGTIADRSGDAPFRHCEIRTPAIVASRYWPSDKPPAELYCSEVIGVVDDKDAAESTCGRSTEYIFELRWRPIHSGMNVSKERKKKDLSPK